MGFGIKELVVILVIVILLFGTRKLKNIGTDLGSAIKGFRKSMTDDKTEDDEEIDDAPGQLGADTRHKTAEHGEHKEAQK